MGVLALPSVPFHGTYKVSLNSATSEQISEFNSVKASSLLLYKANIANEETYSDLYGGSYGGTVYVTYVGDSSLIRGGFIASLTSGALFSYCGDGFNFNNHLGEKWIDLTYVTPSYGVPVTYLGYSIPHPPYSAILDCIYPTESDAREAISNIFNHTFPITYRLTNTTTIDAPVEARVGDNVIVQLEFPAGYGIVNPSSDVRVTSNGVIVPSTYSNGQLVFTMPDPS